MIRPRRSGESELIMEVLLYVHMFIASSKDNLLDNLTMIGLLSFLKKMK